MKQRIDQANSPDNAHQDCQTKSEELKRLEDELQRVNLDKQNVESHSQQGLIKFRLQALSQDGTHIFRRKLLVSKTDLVGKLLAK